MSGFAASSALNFTPNLRAMPTAVSPATTVCVRGLAGGWLWVCRTVRAGTGRRGGNVLRRLDRGWICGWFRCAVSRRWGRIGFGRRQLAGVIAPRHLADLVLQLPVLLGEFFQLLLRGGRARQRQHVRGQLLFAAVNALFDDVRVAGVRVQFQILLVMINRRGGIGRLFLVKPAEFKMRRRRMRDSPPAIARTPQSRPDNPSR